MEEHRNRLEEMKPGILVGQPSLLLMLAAKMERGTLHISPRIVISIAEVLEQEDEAYLKKVFRQKVIHQVYQCTEGCLACTCSHGTLHLNEDIVQIEREYLDEKRFIPVVTDMERKAQPVIRYRLNDILVERKNPCGCKSPCLALEKIEGREDDMFSFLDKQGQEKMIFPDFIRRCILFALGNPGNRAAEYRIVQKPDGRIIVYANLESEEKEWVFREFEKLAQDRDLVLPGITFEPYYREKGRKLKRIECEKKQ